MEKAVRSDYFVRRLFCSSEIVYANAKGNAGSRAASFASAFAAREAFAKASGISMYKVALSSHVYLERTEGAPRLVVSAGLDAGFAEGRKRTWVSLSHDGDYAVAVVVIETL
jgi:holo-[acyl-carrier protein] synthase